MSKIIAVWGSPSSGKTAFSMKLALNIYDRYKSTVIILHSDRTAPVLPVLFPNRKQDELFSVGQAMSETEITVGGVISTLVVSKGRSNFGILGFTDGENKHTYAAFGEAKVKTLFSVLKTLADYIIIDCTSDLDNPISRTAVTEADSVLRLAAPDPKSVSFYSSQMPLYGDPAFRLDQQIQGLCVTASDVILPVAEAKQYFRDTVFTLPYSRKLKKQMLDGRLLDDLRDKKYNKVIYSIAERLV